MDFARNEDGTFAKQETERDRVVESIQNRREEELERDNQALRDAAADQAARVAQRELEAEEEERRQREEDEAALMSPEEALDRIMEDMPELSKNRRLAQAFDDRMNNSLNAEGGFDAGEDGLKVDYRIVRREAESLLTREKEIKKDPALSRIAQNEDARENLVAKRRREVIDEMNQHVPRPDPEGADAIVSEFVNRFPEIVNDPVKLAAAKLEVDRLQNEGFKKEGTAPNGWDIYRTAVENVKRQNALDELSAGRASAQAQG